MQWLYLTLTVDKRLAGLTDNNMWLTSLLYYSKVFFTQPERKIFEVYIYIVMHSLINLDSYDLTGKRLDE